MKPPTIDALARMSAAELESHFIMHTVALDAGTYAIRAGEHLIAAESVSELRGRFNREVAASRRARSKRTLADRIVEAVENLQGWTPVAGDNSGRTLREVVEETIQEWRAQASGGLADNG